MHQIKSCFSIDPLVLKSAVVGKVTPVKSPTAANEGPLKLKIPAKSLGCIIFLVVPLSCKLARPMVAFNVIATGNLFELLILVGNAPVDTSSILRGKSL